MISDENIIEVKNLSVVYDLGKANETLAIKDVSIHVKKHEFVILFGPSGCGKSTLLYTIAGLLSPIAGEIWINGKDITKMNPDQIAHIHRIDLGIVFQQYNLVPTISVLDNVVLPQTWRGVPKKIRYPIGRKLLKKFGLEGQESKYPQEMSGGQQQRASIARALVNDAPIIIADEPTGNLDSKATKVVLDILGDLNLVEKKTILMVTHDASMFEYADRIIFLKDGRVVKEELNPERIGRRQKYADVVSHKKTQEEILRKKYQAFANSLSEYFLNLNELRMKDEFEKIIIDRLEKKISKPAFEELLKKPMRDGGIGLSDERVKEIEKRLSVILYETELLRKKSDDELEHSKLSLEIGELRRYLLDDFDKKLSFRQIKALDEAISSYIHKAIDDEQFKRLITLPEIQGGVGLSFADAYTFLSKLKLVLELR